MQRTGEQRPPLNAPPLAGWTQQGHGPIGTMSPVSIETSKLLEKALKLPVGARAALAGSLIESLDEVIDENAEDAWAEEIARRVRELDSGKAKTIPWSKARRMILGQ